VIKPGAVPTDILRSAARVVVTSALGRARIVLKELSGV